MKRELLILVLSMSLVALVACARAAEPTPAPRPGVTPVVTPTPAPTPTPAMVRPTEWTVVIADDTGGGDPFMDYGTNGPYTLQPHVMESFVAILDPEGGRNVSPQGVLAKSWEIPDDKTIVFRLREGIKFHNGEELTAEHFKYAYETILATKPPLRTGPVASLGEAVVLDKHTIRFAMPSPFATALPQSMSILAASMVRKEMGGESFGKKPVGTGPYKVVQEWVRDRPLVMESFDG